VALKSSNGLEWKTLLDSDMVNESIMAPAEATNPTRRSKCEELGEIRAMQVTIARVALSEIQEGHGSSSVAECANSVKSAAHRLEPSDVT
jgi:hypothetical protein